MKTLYVYPQIILKEVQVWLDVERDFHYNFVVKLR